jgi:transposase
MPTAVSMRKRVQIIFWHGYSSALPTKLSNHKIAKKVGVSPHAVRKWIEDYEKQGDLTEKPRPGRPRTVSPTVVLAARAMLLKPGFGGLASAARELQRRGNTFYLTSKATLSRRLKEIVKTGVKPIIPKLSRPVGMLSVLCKLTRRLWAATHIVWDWSNVMFTDRKRFYLWYPGSQVMPVQWVEEGQRYELPVSINPLCVNVYVGLTKYGATGMIMVTGTSKSKTKYKTKAGKQARNITATEYEHVLKTFLLPRGQELMSKHGHTSWVFQQDNDPTHRDAGTHIRSYNKSHGTYIKLLQGWPPHSPDLSPIENMWAYVDRKVKAAGCKNFAAFVEKLQELTSSVPKRWCEAAIMGMRQRLIDTCKLKGGRILH